MNYYLTRIGFGRLVNEICPRIMTLLKRHGISTPTTNVKVNRCHAGGLGAVFGDVK